MAILQLYEYLMHSINYIPFCFKEFPSEFKVLSDIAVGLFLDLTLPNSTFSNFEFSVSSVK